MPRDDFRCSVPLRVRWGEVDPQGIVFNAHYLSYFDVGAAEYWRAIGVPYPAGFHEHGLDTFAVKAMLEFHGPAHYDDDLEVVVRTARTGRTSLRLAIEIERGVERLVSGELIYVIGDAVTRTPTPLPEWLLSAIRSYERVAPEAG